MALGRRKEAATPLIRPRLYQQLAAHITAFIEAQGLAPGDRLPPERELAVELGVSRATLAQALVALEMQGRVAVRHGDGAVILDPAERVAAVVTALAGYTPEALELARLPVMAGVLSAAAFGPDELRTAAADREIEGGTAAEVWAAIRLAAGTTPLVDIDLALERAGAPIPRQIVADLPALAAAVRAGQPVAVPGGR